MYASCASEEICEFGKPIKNKKGEQLFCGMSPTPDKCPNNTYCKVHPTDMFAVCCNHCPSGDAVFGDHDEPLQCNQTKLCPKGSHCQNRGFNGICCKDKEIDHQANIINETCLLPLDEGRQQAAVGAVKRWTYNNYFAQCQEFTFVPSGGNANNFLTKESCLETCGNDSTHCLIASNLIIIMLC